MKVSEMIAMGRGRSEDIVANVRRLERIAEAAEKLVRNIDAGTPHPIDMARLRQEVKYPTRE